MRAAIIGSSIARDSDVENLSLEELIYKAARAALSDARVSHDDVDQVCLGSSDGLDGRAISPMVTAASVGGVHKSVMNVSSSGEHALILAALQIMAGRSRLCIVANWAKPSETPLEVIDRLTLDPFYYRKLAFDRVAWLELQTQALLASPLGSAWRGATPADLISKRKSSDGAVVLVLADEGTAQRLGAEYTLISGFGSACDSYWRGAEELIEMPSVRAAATHAYRLANIANPARSFSAVEVMDYTPLHLVPLCRALQLVAAEDLGKLSSDIAAGKRPNELNPSGGLAVRDLDFASGLVVVATLHQHLKQHRGCGLAHAATPNGMQGNSVFVLNSMGSA